MKRIPYAAIIIENTQGELLLLLRDNKSTIVFPNHWTLIGGKVKADETPEVTARRELVETSGLDTELVFWKRYERQHPVFVVDQHLYVGKVDASGEGQMLQFFRPEEIRHLKIGYGFKALLDEYFLMKAGHPHVHYA